MKEFTCLTSEDDSSIQIKRFKRVTRLYSGSQKLGHLTLDNNLTILILAPLLTLALFTLVIFTWLLSGDPEIISHQSSSSKEIRAIYSNWKFLICCFPLYFYGFP